MDEEFLLKPMNCPHHCEVYNFKPYSYKDLPKRFAEFGTVYRYEQSGELHGLTRVRGFTQDDAHIFCTEDQITEESKKVCDLVLSIYKDFGFDKVYKKGLNIKTPLDLNLQNIATNALRDGLIAYDKRKGWRGPLTNKNYSNKWFKDLKKFKLEKILAWDIAIVKNVNKFSTLHNQFIVEKYPDVFFSSTLLLSSACSFWCSLVSGGLCIVVFLSLNLQTWRCCCIRPMLMLTHLSTGLMLVEKNHL